MERSVVYTSFDGDQMCYIDCMREFVLKLDRIPLNPEHALGYYISTNTHQDSKAEVMKDCLSLVRACDEFWIFVEDEEVLLSQLPEGIILELLLWVREKKASVRFFSLHQMMLNLVQVAERGSGDAYVGRVREFGERDLQQDLDPNYFAELDRFLTEMAPILRPTVFIDIRDEDFKYVDWARKRAYELGYVPIIPQCLIPEPTYVVCGKSEEYAQNLEHLRKISGGIWAVYESAERLVTLQGRYSGYPSVIEFVSMKAMNVPKYANPRRWSITTKEVEENLKK